MSETNEHNIIRLHKGVNKAVEWDDTKTVTRNPDVEEACRAPDGKKYGLTSMQERFCQIFAKEQVTMMEAFKKAGYSTGGKEQTVWNNVSTLMAKPKIKERIRELRREGAEREEAEGVRLRGFVRERLEKLADSAKTDTAKLKALEMLGKMDTVQMFSDQIKQVIEDNRDKAELEEALRDKLEAVFSKAV